MRNLKNINKILVFLIVTISLFSINQIISPVSATNGPLNLVLSEEQNLDGNLKIRTASWSTISLQDTSTITYTMYRSEVYLVKIIYKGNITNPPSTSSTFLATLLQPNAVCSLNWIIYTSSFESGNYQCYIIEYAAYKIVKGSWGTKIIAGRFIVAEEYSNIFEINNN